MNKKITLILIIITLIILAVIIYIVKEDRGIDSFSVIDKSFNSKTPIQESHSLIFYSADDPDIYIFLKLKNVNKGEKFRFVILYKLESEKQENNIFQTTDITIEKRGPQIIEVSLARIDNLYKTGEYLVELYYNEKLIDTKEFTIR